MLILPPSAHCLGYVPRFVEFLVTPQECSVITDWGDLLYQDVWTRYSGLFGRFVRVLPKIVLLSLLQLDVPFCYVLIVPHFFQVGLDLTLDGMTVDDAEKENLVFLRPVDGYVVVYLPFVILRVFQRVISHSAPKELQFPADLLFSPTANRPWSWQDFEVLLPYHQAALGAAISFAQPPRVPQTLAQLLRGGIGPQSLLTLSLSFPATSGVFFESHQCAHSRLSIALMVYLQVPSHTREPSRSGFVNRLSRSRRS